MDQNQFKIYRWLWAEVTLWPSALCEPCIRVMARFITVQDQKIWVEQNTMSWLNQQKSHKLPVSLYNRNCGWGFFSFFGLGLLVNILQQTQKLLFPSFLVPISLQVRNWEHWNPIPSAHRQHFTQLLSEMSPHISTSAEWKLPHREAVHIFLQVFKFYLSWESY